MASRRASRFGHPIHVQFYETDMPKIASTFVFMALTWLVAGTLHAQGLFADKNLEAAVRRYVFEKRNNDQPLTEDDVVNISTIQGKNKGIKDLSGLEKCRSLAQLDLEGNEIESLEPIKDLKNIQSLTLAKNKIKNIQPLEGLSKLQYVQLADNQVSDLSPLAKLTNLRSLYLSRNQIKDLTPIAGLGKLWSLYLDGNQIENIAPLANLKTVDSLDLRGNAVSDIAPLKGLTEWKYLLLDNNKLTDVKVLIEMGKADKEGSQRFAPFWNIYLSGNPLSEDAKKSQLEELKKWSKKVVFE
jgi:internalin A